MVARTDCFYYFHAKCLDDWLLVSKNTTAIIVVSTWPLLANYLWMGDNNNNNLIIR